jgi:metal-dependent hydrolase (beta-lactamase superfamily II)
MWITTGACLASVAAGVASNAGELAEDEARKVVVTILADRYLGRRSETPREHAGLCMHVEVVTDRVSRMIIECGSRAEDILRGLAWSGLKVSTVDAYVLSGWDGERTSGILRLFGVGESSVKEYQVFWPHAVSGAYTVEPRAGGWTDYLLLNQPTEVVPGAYLTGTIRTADLIPETGEPVRVGDRAVYIRLRDQGLVVLTGCTRCGIVKAIETAMDCSGETSLHAVIGGFHMEHASDAAMQNTIRQLKQFDPEYVVPLLCSGTKAKARMQREMPTAFRTHSLTEYRADARMIFA